MIDKEEKFKWEKDKVADAICQVTLRQNLCDHSKRPILVVGKRTIRFLRRKYCLTTRRAWDVIHWAFGYNFLKCHPMTSPIITPENAHEPDVYFITPEIYEERIKSFLNEEPSIYSY